MCLHKAILKRLHLQIKSHSEVLGVKNSTYEFGDTIQPLTLACVNQLRPFDLGPLSDRYLFLYSFNFN
jgi:hypothetical protein